MIFFLPVPICLDFDKNTGNDEKTVLVAFTFVDRSKDHAA